MAFGVTVISSPVKSISLRIRRAEWYTFPMLIADFQEEMPEVADQLKQIIFDLFGGVNTDKMNAATLMPMLDDNEISVLSALPPLAFSKIRRLILKEIQKESTNINVQNFFISKKYNLDDLKELVHSQIQHSDEVNTHDYVFVPTFTQNHVGESYVVSVYYAINNHKNDQSIKDLIKLNVDKIVKSMNDISVLMY